MSQHNKLVNEKELELINGGTNQNNPSKNNNPIKGNSNRQVNIGGDLNGNIYDSSASYNTDLSVHNKNVSNSNITGGKNLNANIGDNATINF